MQLLASIDAAVPAPVIASESRCRHPQRLEDTPRKKAATIEQREAELADLQGRGGAPGAGVPPSMSG